MKKENDFQNIPDIDEMLKDYKPYKLVFDKPIAKLRREDIKLPKKIRDAIPEDDLYMK